jgi:hypothetical protein
MYFCTSACSMVLLLMFLSPPLRGAGPMALMLGHEWQHIYIYMHVMTWADCPTSAGLAGVGSTSPARGRPVADMLLCLLLLCMISGNFWRAAQHVYLFCAWPGAIFLRAGALQQASLVMSCCPVHVYIISESSCMNSEAATCIMSQAHACALQIITFHHCTNLLYPAHMHNLHIPCIHNHLFYIVVIEQRSSHRCRDLRGNNPLYCSHLPPDNTLKTRAPNQNKSLTK